MIRSAESKGSFSIFRKTNQIPTTIKASGRTKVPQPATCDSISIHQLVTVPRCDVSKERMVKNPTRVRKIPRISSFRSFEILFQLQLDFEEVLRDRFELALEVDLLVRDGDFDERVDVRELVFFRLEADFCGKINLQN